MRLIRSVPIQFQKRLRVAAEHRFPLFRFRGKTLIARAEQIEPFDLLRRAVAEAIGTALLLAAVVGSGIMGERLANGNMAIALLANAIATGTALGALISSFGSVSGAHFNPVVSIAAVFQLGFARRDVPVYVGAQIVGAFAGVAIANVMFGQPVFFASHHSRYGEAQLFSEVIATFGLLAVILGCARSRPTATPIAVGAYITAAYWFTASTSFANPAVTLARTVSDTFAGIRPADALGFIIAQVFGAAVAIAIFGWLIPQSYRNKDMASGERSDAKRG